MSILSTRSILNPTTMLRILVSKSINDKASCFILSDWANPSRIRTHISDQTLNTRSNIDSFVQLLGHHHGLTSTEVNLIGCVHLHGRSCVRKWCITFALFLLNLFNDILFPIEMRKYSFHILLVLKLHLLTIHSIEIGLELLSPLFKGSINCPIFFWLEGIDFLFPVNNQFKRNGLHPTSRKSLLHLFP